MNKKIGGLTLALAAVTSMAAAPAHAERIEVTFTGTFTSSYTYEFCGTCSEGVLTVTPLAPLSFSQKWVVDIGKAAGMDDPMVFSYPATDADGRPVQAEFSSQTMGRQSLNASTEPLLLPSGLLAWANVAAPTDPVQGQKDALHYRESNSYAGMRPPEDKTDIWGMTRSGAWNQADGSPLWANVQLFNWAPFAVTSANVGESFTTSQFIDRMNQDFWCAGCRNSFSVDLMTHNRADGGMTMFTYAGTVSGFSMRSLSAVVPEPSTYALMLAGVAAVGFAARRRRAAGAIKS
ncbi:PEP-CTERM sorting domain-containing protein [Mitsuaria sp. CC2]|uniref:PEP-CTERM sorting domain-containing protein n=1 Tax=Mitsuaria sp. CC2 TaxID=3029186 RepID=UPI003B8D87D7